MFKTCSKCGEQKPIEDFTPRKDSADGRRRACADCCNAQKQQTAEYRRAHGQADGDQEELLDAAELDVEGCMPFGTALERATAESFLRLGSIAAAARELQMRPEQVRAHLSELRRRAAARGWAPGHDAVNPAPIGYHVKGHSTYYKADGTRGGQWVKTKKDEEDRVQALLDAMSTIADRWTGKAEPAAPAPADLDEDLLCVYPMGDPHLGMFSWHVETGHDFDLKIGERELREAVDRLVESAPPAKNGLLISLGDFFHSDNRQGTTTGGTVLDTDGRWTKVLGVGIRTMRHNIDRGLEKHEHMHGIILPGNHDWHTSLMMALCLAQFYENEPRVTIDTSPDAFHWFRFGKILLGATHGDTCKVDRLQGVMSCDRAQDWGETWFRHWYTGHVHHDSVKELQGCTVETLRTLAPKDDWHHRSGYRSERDMKMDVWHKTRGRIRRHIVNARDLSEAMRVQNYEGAAA